MIRMNALRPAGAAARLAVAAFVAVSAAVSAADPDVDRLARWNSLVLEAVSDSNSSPCLASRNLAILHGAAFDAVNAFSGKYSAFHYEKTGPVDGLPEAAMAGAIWQVVRELFPSHAAVFDRERDRQMAAFLSTADANVIERSFAFGARVAVDVLEARADDGASTRITYVPKKEPGKWRRTPPRYRPPELPNWPLVRPFVLESADQFRPAGPPPLDSEAYRAALREVWELGGADSDSRSLYEEEGAVFWAYFNYTSTPAGHWNKIACWIAEERDLSLLETARLLALLNLATADAAIAAWDCKYHYEFWRPIHAIRASGEDFGVDLSDWESLLNSPPHPDYVSGHSTFSGAAAAVLASFFGDDAVAFPATSPDLPEVQRRYNSFWECAEEIGRSRLYGGIHFSFSNRDGLELGRRVGEWVGARSLQPVAGRGAAMALTH